MKIFRPAGLAAGEKFGGSKVLEILVSVTTSIRKKSPRDNVAKSGKPHRYQ